MSVDGSLKIKFENMSICDFWIAARKEFKELMTLSFHTSCRSHQRICVSKASLYWHRSKRNTGNASQTEMNRRELRQGTAVKAVQGHNDAICRKLLHFAHRSSELRFYIPPRPQSYD
jgi:hypothetical protein